jgi:transporter family protein
MPAYVPWALFASVTYGLVAILLKLTFRGIHPAVALVVTNVGIVGVGIAWALLQGSAVFKNVGFNQYALTLGIAAVVLASSIFAYYRALSLGPASAVVPIFALNLAVAALLGFFVLDEPIRAHRVAGIVLAGIAVVLLSR